MKIKLRLFYTCHT